MSNLDVDSDLSVAILADVTDRDGQKRAIHASQFCYSLWLAARSNKVCIEYHSKSGEYVLRHTLAAIECNRVLTGVMESHDLAREVKFEFVK